MSIQPRVALIGLLSSTLVLIAPSLESQIQESSDYSHYRVISRDSLFRPLGWTRPIKERRYKLIGTKIDDDGTGWAYMSTSGSRDVMTVFRVGSQIEGMSIKKITSRKVIMENGETYELGAVAFISPEGAERGATRRNRNSKGEANRSSAEVSEGSQSQRKADGSAKKTGRAQRRSSSASQRQRWQERIEAYQKASPEEQVRMMQQFRRGRRR